MTTTRPRELTTPGELAHACAGDPLCVWTAQGMPGGVRAWAMDGAVAVATPNVCRRDRLTVHGPVESAVALVARVLPLLPPGYRLLGGADLIAALTRELAGLEESSTWGWMDTDASRRPGAPGVAAGWLEPDERADVDALLDTGFPSSYARPGHPGVRRWAGMRGHGRQLLAVAADAWSAPTMGFIAGVCVHPSARGRGLAGSICSFVTRELLAAHGRAALMVDASNAVAIRTYARLGFVWRTVRSARIIAA